MYTTSRNYVHRLWQIALALATLVVWGAGAATAQVAVIIAPAANDEVRGDGADDKNLIRWTISQAPDFQYIIQITEMDQSNPSQPIASPISFTIPFPQSPGSGIVNEGNNTYSLPFDFNRSELSAVGSGLFRITLRATSFGGAFDTISDPVLYNKGRPHPAFSMNTDDPAHVKFTLNAGDPDATPDYRYRLSFARVGGGSAPGPMTFTTNATSVNESAFANLALAAGAVYDVTLEVSDTQNQPVAFAGQGLSKSITQQVVVNAPPVVAIQSPPSGTVINAPNLPYSSPFDITATDDSGQPINLEVDVNGDGVPEATGVVASGGTTTINVPFTTSGAKTVRVRGKDSLNLYGDYVSVDVRLNLPPSVAIESPAEDAKFAFTGSPTLVPFTITATDDFSAQITVSFDLDGDSVPDQIDVVDNGQPAFIQLSVLVPGTVHVTATPTDGDDVSGAPVTRTIRLDAPPQVTINGPSANSVFTFAGSPTFVTFAVTVTDDFSSLLTVNIDRDNDSIPDVVFPVVNGVQTDIPVPFDAAGNYTVRIDATDENLLPGTAVTRNIIVNDIPQTEILDIQPGTYNPATRTWTIEAGISLVQVTFRATNEVRQNNMPLWLKWRFTNSEDFTTSPSTPPAPGTIHQVQFGVPHTYASEGDYVLSFGAQETFDNGTIGHPDANATITPDNPTTVTVKVANLPSAARDWQLYE